MLYRLAAMHAKKNNLDDCIISNSHNNICDTSIANIFIVKDNSIYTPPLNEGCIAGVMRRWILENINFNGSSVIEQPLSVEDLEEANEIFLTNSLYLLRWVKHFRNIEYTNVKSQLIYDEVMKTF